MPTITLHQESATILDNYLKDPDCKFINASSKDVAFGDRVLPAPEKPMTANVRHDADKDRAVISFVNVPPTTSEMHLILVDPTIAALCETRITQRIHLRELYGESYDSLQDDKDDNITHRDQLCYLDSNNRVNFPSK